MVDAWPGATLCLGAGRYMLDLEVTLAQHDVVLRGAGMNETILDFTGQIIGGNGVLITGDRVVVEDLKVLNTPGDGIRATATEDITFRRVGVIWEADESDQSGAYGLYPVGCTGVTIDACEVKGARDAGIYVGQSTKILVKDSEAWGNVAGIEIENSDDAEVVNNYAHDNTAGILVFNLPGLPKPGGERTLVHNNRVENNNTRNFAAGGIVKNVPGGTGMLILACDNNEFRDNIIKNNNSTGIIVVSYIDALFGGADDPTYDRYPENNWVHSNTFESNGDAPMGILDPLIKEPRPLSDILWDGCIPPDSQNLSLGQCFTNNGDADFLHIDFCAQVGERSTDLAPYDCEGLTLPNQTGAVLPLENPADEPIRTACSKLSDYKFFQGDMKGLNPAPGVTRYEVTAPLFSDHTTKHRFVAMPEGESADYSADDGWDWPLGTILIKTFTMPAELASPYGDGHRIETRLYIREPAGWVAENYRWNAEQTEAVLDSGGGPVDVTYTALNGETVATQYVIPNRNQCAGCHARDGQSEPLGAITRQLNRDVASTPQLVHLSESGVVAAADFSSAPAFVDPADESADLEQRARAYLHSNCGHCHREGASAEQSGLFLDWSETDSLRLGVCKLPAAAGAGAGGGNWDVVPGHPEDSILVQRMASTDPDVKMPELPSLEVDQEGVQLISDWIAAMPEVDCSAILPGE
jgi:parallel beta-helix repeat protein